VKYKGMGGFDRSAVWDWCTVASRRKKLGSRRRY